MLGERGAADQPRHEAEREPRGPRQRIGVEDHVAAVEAERKHRHRPLREQLVLGPDERHKRHTGPRRKGDHGRALAHRRLDAVVRDAAPCLDCLVERGDAVGKVGTEAKHEAHRKVAGGNGAELLRMVLAREVGDADEGFGLDVVANLADFVPAPQHRQRRDRQRGAPGGEQRQRRQRDIGKLHGDGVAGQKSKLDEERGERIDGLIGLAVAESSRMPETERLKIGRIGERDDAGPLARASPEQAVCRERAARLVPLTGFGGERAHGTSHGLRAPLSSAVAPGGSSHHVSIW